VHRRKTANLLDVLVLEYKNVFNRQSQLSKLMDNS